MKRILLIALAGLTIAGCTATRGGNPYEKPPFYAKYLNTGSALDAEIARTLDALRQNPDSPELHNHLGALLVDKGFPNDALVEFERAIDESRRYHPAWYNLGLVRASRGDEIGARRAFRRTVELKPGHAAALFQLGLIEEKRHHTDRAIALFAKAFTINPALLRVDVNPRILDSELTHLALLRAYPDAHTRLSMQFQGGAAPRDNNRPEAPSKQAQPESIVPPAPPATDPTQQPAPPPPSR